MPDAPRRRPRIAALALFAILVGPLADVPARAHPPSIVNETQERGIGEEIVAFRKRVAEAIQARDAAKLRDFYSPRFVHTHGSGKVDGKDARIVGALAGDPVIETAPVDDLVIRAPIDWVAIATGRSPVRAGDGKTYEFRWTTVYVRAGDSWQIAASQAMPLAEIKP